ncbi:MAG: [LysW]-aminoadipate/[LysW]-glutamate kinase [Thaumarchaeota archaeon]|nr:[LysW]-aminoadipate/[LysW]-glutamate kinase [Nitrososphaerota archaeon]
MITVKVGGSIVDGLHPSFVAGVEALAPGGVVVVHGGGKEVSRVCAQLGKEPRFVTSPGGIRSRYTDMETAEIFTMVMSGRINQGIVRMLQKSGIPAVGLAGADAQIIRARRKKRLVIVNERGRPQAIDGGYTGRITEVNGEFLKSLLERGMVPVVSPVALSEEFESLNVDGDRAAAYVAGAVGADTVVFITDVDGLMMDGALVPGLTLREARDVRPKVGPGMEKKILAAVEALEMGVERAAIASGRREGPLERALAGEGCTVIRDG